MPGIFIRIWIVCAALLVCPDSSFSQPSWDLIRDKNGIKIYASREETSNFKLVKAISTTKGTISKAIQIFEDVERQPQWVYSTKKAYVIRKISNRDFIYYVESALPWPVTDRYLLARMKIEVSEDEDVLLISTISDSTEDISSSGKIRIKHFVGKWEIRAIDKDNISITYYLDIDPGGDLPPSIVNLFISKGPYKSLLRLGEMLRE
jgi:hypothetical protein